MITQEQKEIRKKFAGYKRVVLQIAGEIHDIVEDRVWTDYVKLPKLSQKIDVAMQDVIKFRKKYDFLK